MAIVESLSAETRSPENNWLKALTLYRFLRPARAVKRDFAHSQGVKRRRPRDKKRRHQCLLVHRVYVYLFYLKR
jgi:hypothetical protein